MTKHVDVYGRTWFYQPGHDTAKMLQISRAKMWEVYRFHHLIYSQGQFVPDNASSRWPEVVDCYLLRSNHHTWYAGIRFSDEGSDYLSPCIDNRLLDFVVSHHHQNASLKEWEAYHTILGTLP